MSTPEPTGRPLALVTGASTGIGRSLAQQFADHGFDLVAVADDAELDIAAAGLRQSGADVTAVRVDLTTEAGVEEVWRVVSDLDRPVDAAALNAGTAANGRFWENSLVDELRVVDLNVRSVVHLAHLLLPDMVNRDRGRLLVTASIAAKAPGPYYATYAASKAFVHSFAEAVRFELVGTGVTVTSLLPGPTDTAFFGRVGMVQTLVGRMPKDDPEEVARDGYEALMAGKASVVGGSLVNKAFTVGSRALPDQVKAFAQSVLTKPRDR
jgi:uncharacterized protein